MKQDNVPVYWLWLLMLALTAAFWLLVVLAVLRAVR